LKIQAPFGFVTSCYEGDKFMVQATLGSMRHYCPDVPICLIVDGNVDVSDIQKVYDLIVLRVANLPNQDMKSLIARSTRSKLAGMWEGPFEHFVWMDSDAIAWGDFTRVIDRNLDFEIFWSDEVSLPADAQEIPPWLPHFYFDPNKLKSFDPGFEWRGLPYFCDGVFAAKRNAFSFEEFQEVFSWSQTAASPWAKDFVCQPFVNYLVQSKKQKGQIKVGRSDLQYLTRHVGDQEISEELANSRWRFPKEINRPRAVHFCGRKPLIQNRRSDGKAFTIARLEHYRKTRGEFGAWAAVLNEERKILQKRVVGKIRKKLRIAGCL
jgi:hypothetical protein